MYIFQIVHLKQNQARESTKLMATSAIPWSPFLPTIFIIPRDSENPGILIPRKDYFHDWNFVFNHVRIYPYNKWRTHEETDLICRESRGTSMDKRSRGNKEEEISTEHLVSEPRSKMMDKMMDDLARSTDWASSRNLFQQAGPHLPVPPPPPWACEIILARDSPRPMIRRCNTGAGYRFSRWMALMMSILFVGGQVGFWDLFCLAVFGKLQGGKG